MILRKNILSETESVRGVLFLLNSFALYLSSLVLTNQRKQKVHYLLNTTDKHK